MIVWFLSSPKKYAKISTSNLKRAKSRYSKRLMSYIIRPMQDRDIPQAIEIDHEAFPTQWPHPTYISFKQELRNRLAHYIVAYQQIEFLPTDEPTTINKTFW